MDVITFGAIETVGDAIAFATFSGIALGVVLGFFSFAAYQTWQDRREALALAARRAPARAQGN